jgi:hypothetical protein
MSARGLAGRVSMDHPFDGGWSGAVNFLAPVSNDDYFRKHSFDRKTIDSISSTKLMELLADASPDVSKALWDFLLLCNPGYEYKVMKPGGKTEDTTGRAVIADFLAQLHGPYAAPNVVPFDQIIASLFMGVFLRGAFLAELVLDEAGREALEIATPDPAVVTFRRISDAARGRVWQLGQHQNGNFVPLDRETVAYIPIHPFPGQPRGRAMAAPALFTTLFLIGLLHDLRRVITQQGYPRHDINIKLKEILAMMPEEDQGDATKTEEWINKVTAMVEDAYAGLEPDDAWVHLDAFELGKPVGAGDKNALGGIGDVIKALERMAVRALKTLPLLMGINEATSETHANRQWEIYAAGIKAIQHPCETLIERFLNLVLQVRGMAAIVEFRFAELRAAERLRDAQAESLEITNEARKRDEGWQTQDESSQKIVGHKAVSQTPLRTATNSDAGNLTELQADPGSQRSVATAT